MNICLHICLSTGLLKFYFFFYRPNCVMFVFYLKVYFYEIKIKNKKSVTMPNKEH